MFIYIIVTRILLLVLKVFFCLEYYSSGNLLITAEIQTNKIYIYKTYTCNSPKEKFSTFMFKAFSQFLLSNLFKSLVLIGQCGGIP